MLEEGRLLGVSKTGPRPELLPSPGHSLELQVLRATMRRSGGGTQQSVF